MAGLLLINFEQNPDTIYAGFEPQAFDDKVHGRGLLVIGWRANGRVDVFYQDRRVRSSGPAARLRGRILLRTPRRYGVLHCD